MNNKDKRKKRSYSKEDSKEYKGSGRTSKEPKDTRKIHKSRSYDKVSTDTSTNSVDFYVVNEQMLKDAASLSYFNPLGNKVALSSESEFLTNYLGPTGVSYQNTNRLDRSVPGIMALRYVPTIGKAEDNSSPANLAARNIYAFVRKANSGSKNYDAPNMMMYLMACDSIYTFYQWMLRVYGLLRKYSTLNQYYNEAILKALNVDASAFAGFMADFRAYINKYALKANSLCVPNTFTIYQRHMYLVSCLFKDTETAKAQLYVFNPEFLYEYDEPNGKLKALPLAAYPTLLTPTDVMAYGDTLLNAVLTSEDMAIIKGDILKAFGENGIYSLSQIGDDYVTTEVHDYEILTQIQAGNFLGPVDLSISGMFDITEDTTPGSQTEGALRQSVTSVIHVTASGVQPILGTGNLGKIINMYVDAPTPADTMVASRLIHHSVPYIQGDASSAIIYNTAVEYGTEVLTTFSIWVLDNYHVGQKLVSNTISEFTNGLYNWGEIMAAISPFEWHPIVYGLTPTATLAATPTLAVNYQGMIDLDWDNYTTFNKVALARMHECATLGEFRIPQLGIMV